MPAQPFWIGRLPQIRKTVADAGGRAWWDRPAIEELFAVKRRQAIYLLVQMGAERLGGNLAIDGSALLRFLNDRQRQDAALEEQDRSARVRQALAQARRERPARSISIALPADAERLDFAGLPAGIDLQRRQLRIDFETPRELLENLVALAQAMMNDFGTFEEKLRPEEESD